MDAPKADKDRGVNDSVREDPFLMNVGRAKQTRIPVER